MENLQTAGSSADEVVRASVTRSWGALASKPVALVFAGLVVTLLSAVTLSALSVPLGIGYTKLAQRALAGEEIATGELFDNFGETLVPGLVVWVLVGIAFFIGSLLLVLPGLLVLFACAFVLPALASGDATGAIDAIKRSASLVKHNPISVLGVVLVAALVSALGAAIVLGFLISLPLTTLLIAAAYEALRHQQLPEGH